MTPRTEARTELVAHAPPMGDEYRRWTLTLTEEGAAKLGREGREMIEDALWLIQAALRGRTEGPLTLPQTKLPIRGLDA